MRGPPSWPLFCAFTVSLLSGLCDICITVSARVGSLVLEFGDSCVGGAACMVRSPWPWTGLLPRSDVVWTGVSGLSCADECLRAVLAVSVSVSGIRNPFRRAAVNSQVTLRCEQNTHGQVPEHRVLRLHDQSEIE
jgi:hypothetical protein